MRTNVGDSVRGLTSKQQQRASEIQRPQGNASSLRHAKRTPTEISKTINFTASPAGQCKTRKTLAISKSPGTLKSPLRMVTHSRWAERFPRAPSKAVGRIRAAAPATLNQNKYFRGG